MTAQHLPHKIVFLDRDGVINRDSSEYIKTWDEFHFIPGSLEAIRRLTENGHTVIVITNQSAVGRKLVPPAVLEDIHLRMKNAVTAAGGRITDIFFCPHRPDEGCPCRKPLPGLIFTARDTYGIDLSMAVMVGDNAKDIECARAARCGAAILVETGNGPSARIELAEKEIKPDRIVKDLEAAVQWILHSEFGNTPSGTRS